MRNVTMHKGCFHLGICSDCCPQMLAEYYRLCIESSSWPPVRALSSSTTCMTVSLSSVGCELMRASYLEGPVPFLDRCYGRRCLDPQSRCVTPENQWLLLFWHVLEGLDLGLSCPGDSVCADSACLPSACWTWPWGCRWTPATSSAQNSQTILTLWAWRRPTNQITFLIPRKELSPVAPLKISSC